MTVTLGGPGRVLDPEEVRSFVRAQIAALDLAGRSLCVVVPDATRSCPLPLLLRAVEEGAGGRTSALTAVIALGTHAPMSDDAVAALVGSTSLPTRNHAWWENDTFTHVGTLSAAFVAEVSGGRLHDAIDVRLNRLVVESDVTLLVGPVLPHEVIGFSGGNKYLFPGLSGQEMIDVTHWLGALITSSEIIGTRGVTPVRALVEAAAELVPGERHALCVVVDHDSGGLESLSFGDPFGAWEAAVEVAAVTHVSYLDRPVQRVLSLVPTRYPDLWTGAKGFYKVEPVVADGGEVVLYAPTSPRSRRCTRASWRSATTAATSSWRSGTATPTSPWASWRTPPICSAPGPTTRSTVSASGSGSPWPPVFPRTSCAGPTSTTSRPTQSNPPDGLPTLTRWSCPMPARSSTGSGRRDPAAYSPG